MCFSGGPSASVTVGVQMLAALLPGMRALRCSFLDLALSSPEHEAQGAQGSLRDTGRGQTLMLWRWRARATEMGQCFASGQGKEELQESQKKCGWPAVGQRRWALP